MLKLNLKVITFLLQVLLVIVAVVVFSFFDPWNIFNSKKLTLRDTPTMVRSIRGIGELITAEYYGEVLKSSGEALELSVKTMASQDSLRLMQMLVNLKDALSDLKLIQDSLNEKLNRRGRVFREFKRNYRHLFENPDYKELMSLILKEYRISEKDLLFSYYANEEEGIDEPFNKKGSPIYVVVRNHVDENYKKTKKEAKRIANHSLVLLGRGWVKVGFDFSSFDEKHFNYIEDRNLIRLTYHSPKIISSAINPWFIPQKKIKGFEFVFVGKSVDKNPDTEENVALIRELKKSCRDNLVRDALNSGIMESAKVNAESSLSELFSLFIGKPTTVRIYSYPHDGLLEDLTNKNVMDANDVDIIDSMVSRYIQEEPTRTLSLLQQVHALPASKSIAFTDWKWSGESWETMTLYHRIVEDHFITSPEQKLLASFLADSIVITRKDLFYYAATHPALYRLMENDPLNDGKIPVTTVDSIKAKKRNEYHEFRKRASVLRSQLSFREIYRSDSLIENFLRIGDLRSAVDYANKVEGYRAESDFNDSLYYNWRLLAYSWMCKDPLVDSLQLNTWKGRIPEYASKSDYFYYLYYTGEFNDLSKGKKLLGVLSTTTQPLKKSKLDKFDSMRSKVQILYKRNRQATVD